MKKIVLVVSVLLLVSTLVVAVQKYKIQVYVNGSTFGKALYRINEDVSVFAHTVWNRPCVDNNQYGVKRYFILNNNKYIISQFVFNPNYNNGDMEAIFVTDLANHDDILVFIKSIDQEKTSKGLSQINDNTFAFQYYWSGPHVENWGGSINFKFKLITDINGHIKKNGKKGDGKALKVALDYYNGLKSGKKKIHDKLALARPFNEDRPEMYCGFTNSPNNNDTIRAKTVLRDIAKGPKFALIGDLGKTDSLGNIYEVILADKSNSSTSFHFWINKKWEVEHYDVVSNAGM